jgi:GH24 family phage-related lysozyme (muramidase)
LPTPSQIKRAARAEKYKAIAREMEAWHERAWRYRGGSASYELAPRRVADRQLSSTLGGPAMKTMQWRRE